MTWCPACGNSIGVGTGVKLGASVECPECGTMLEVISLRPIELDYALEGDGWVEE